MASLLLRSDTARHVTLTFIFLKKMQSEKKKKGRNMRSDQTRHEERVREMMQGVGLADASGREPGGLRHCS
jgi:hypothetical protein